MSEFDNLDPNDNELVNNLMRAHRVALSAKKQGRHPFGAVLIAPDHKTLLLTQGNIDTVNHAESTLARHAAEKYSQDYLWNCSLYSTLEPCAMCAGTIYWANIGRVIFGAKESDLLALTGNHKHNPTMNLPCRSVFSAGQKQIRVWGPLVSVQEEILSPHREFWQDAQARAIKPETGE